jgi:NAD-dependent DNA ligase
LVEKLVSAYAKMKADRDTKETINKNKQAEIDALQAQLRQADATHIAERTSIQERADNDKRTQNAQIDTLTRESQASSARIRDLTDRGIKDRDEFNNDVQGLTREKTELDGMVRTVQGEKRIARATQVPDGTVVAVDNGRSKIFVDIGSKDLVRRDTRFQVLGVGKGNERVHKGYVTLTDDMGDMAEAFIDEPVAGQRIESGDLIYSPIFDRPTNDPNRKVRFVFLGELPGRYPREVAERIITRKGGIVDTEVSVRTDFIILGERESEDDEPLTDTEQYRTASRWGIEVLRARDLAPFLK